VEHSDFFCRKKRGQGLNKMDIKSIEGFDKYRKVERSCKAGGYEKRGLYIKLIDLYQRGIKKIICRQF